MMLQFWVYTLADGRRVLVESGANTARYDPFIGFGVIRAILGAAE